MTHRVLYSRRSRRDLEKIRIYIANESANADTADPFIRQLLDACDSLKDLPARFPPYPFSPRWRMMPAGNYLIFFRIEPEAVSIGHIRHAARRPFGS